jgi:signal transduction histidine kinase
MTVAAPAAPTTRSWLPPGRDAAIALGVAVVEIAGSAVVAGHQNPHRGFDALAVALLLTGALSLAWRCRIPRTVFGVVFATTLAYTVIGYPEGPIWLALIVAFCTTVLEGHRLVAWVSVAVGWALFLWLPSLVGTEDPPPLGGVLALAAWLLVLATTTEIVRIRRERTAEARRAREEEARLRASEEQLRIARELHDVVAHNLSLINVQAGTALHLIDERPELAESALLAIKGASKDALDELRALVDVLRSGAEVAPRLPTPTLADVDDLVERSSAAGVPVELRVRGTRRPLPHTIETAAYRVTQEALTNVARHAGAAHTVVELDYETDALVVRVEDDGRGPVGNGASSGKGLTGMRERVHALGGELEAGANGVRGFRVRARIPIGGPR